MNIELHIAWHMLLDDPAEWALTGETPRKRHRMRHLHFNHEHIKLETKMALLKKAGWRVNTITLTRDRSQFEAGQEPKPDFDVEAVNDLYKDAFY